MTRRSGTTRSWVAGDHVQTPFGKGVVIEVRSNRRLVVQVRDRSLVLESQSVSASADGRRKTPLAPSEHRVTEPYSAGGAARRDAADVVDLHGMTVEEALARAEQVLSDAMLANVPELRFIHGRSGGRLRAALHRRLREIPTVRRFLVDPANAGVTIVYL